VLAAQFESFIDPFIIMLTVPLAVTGALLALWIVGGTLNIYSKIGLVTLVGLITKHGILIVEFANQIQAKGKNIFDAVEEAAVLRLRPILMTTGAMVLGAVPLAVATGAGAESRQQIGWVIVGGWLLGTLLTLFVVPTATRCSRAPQDFRAAPRGRPRRSLSQSRRCRMSRNEARRCWRNRSSCTRPNRTPPIARITCWSSRARTRPAFSDRHDAIRHRPLGAADVVLVDQRISRSHCASARDGRGDRDRPGIVERHVRGR